MLKVRRTYQICFALILIIFSITFYFRESKQAFTEPIKPIESSLPNSAETSESSTEPQEDPFKKFLEQKSKESSIASQAPSPSSTSKMENPADPFKEFLDKQKTQNSLSGVNPFEPASKK